MNRGQPVGIALIEWVNDASDSTCTSSEELEGLLLPERLPYEYSMICRGIPEPATVVMIMMGRPSAGSLVSAIKLDRVL
jgi:hypothetical protein